MSLGTKDLHRHPVLWITAAAILLRLLLFLGRGDYVAFDEGFYLLLGRSLVTGEGYSLIGIPHITLSPLFPLLAGGLGLALGDWIWGGRVIAALASGLLILPAWAVFRRIAPRRTALIATVLIAVIPALAPFVVPFWLGADLWVGAEPLLHLFLFAGIAAWLRADEAPGGTVRTAAGWAGCGALFGLAFLARPEAVIAWGILGLVALAIAVKRRSLHRLVGAVLMGLGFLAVASPYWFHVHEVTGRWALTGRGVAAPAAAVEGLTGGGGGRVGPAAVIESMLWSDGKAYERYLYGLDRSGLRLQSDYWGVYPEPEPRPHDAQAARAAAPASAPAADPPPGSAAGAAEAAPERPPLLRLYARSLGTIFPLLLWPFVILGAAQPRGRAVLRRELPVAATLLGTSLAIVLFVAADPRTQLFLVPLLALYAARGFSLLEQEVQGRVGVAPLRPGFVELMLATVAVVWLLAIDARRLYLSIELGSPHHIVGAQNRAVAEDMDSLFPDRRGPVMSWHPALAVFADRDWRPLPHDAVPRIVRYAAASGAEIIVLSAYYPPDLGVERLNTRYLLLPVPDAREPVRSWGLQLLRGDSIRAVGQLTPES